MKTGDATPLNIILPQDAVANEPVQVDLSAELTFVSSNIDHYVPRALLSKVISCS